MTDFILIVDDNTDNLAVLGKTLKGAGHRVRVAVDGESAVTLATAEPPSLILLDVMMPGIDGFETCRRLKEAPTTLSVPVIFMTALADSETKVKGLSLGAVDYITKPFNEAEVLARVHIQLKLQTLLQTLQTQNQQLQNEMTQRQAAEQALQQLNADLEARVKARTIELHRTLDDLNHAQVQLVQQEKLSALGELMAGVAHEINNPMGCIANNLRFVQEYSDNLLAHIDHCQQLGTSPDVETHAEDIDLDYIRQDLPNLVNTMQTSSDRIRAITQSLRTFARCDTRHKSAFDLHSGLDSTLMILKHRLQADDNRAEIKVVKDYGTIPDLLCFPGQMSQVFMNILANAIDAFDEQRPAQPLVTLRTFVKDDQVQIQISDNAGGMPDAVRANIFDRAYTTKAVGKGTGLG
ncbi:MAG: response regulator, partial [Cyanobacteria bacterium J06632_3]